jgi:hypothetical protein
VTAKAWNDFKVNRVPCLKQKQYDQLATPVDEQM